MGFAGDYRLPPNWLSSSRISGFVMIIAYLLQKVCSVYTIHLFYRSPLVGFLRFLRLLSSTDWETTPVILNFNNDISGEWMRNRYVSFTFSVLLTRFKREKHGNEINCRFRNCGVRKSNSPVSFCRGYMDNGEKN